MFDRIFFPALAYAALVSATAAFVADAIPSAPQSRQAVVQLERVVVVAKRDSGRIALAETAEPAVAAR